MPRKTGTPRSVTGRVLAILNAFESATPAPLSLGEISHTCGLPLSTTHRLVAELLDGRLLSRDPDRRYRIGPRMRELIDLSPSAPTP